VSVAGAAYDARSTEVTEWPGSPSSDSRLMSMAEYAVTSDSGTSKLAGPSGRHLAEREHLVGGRVEEPDVVELAARGLWEVLGPDLHPGHLLPVRGHRHLAMRSPAPG
jgi:hypothetical protein